ncbi:uncharacterized protein LOC129792995 [Lutzomyia longipalpis]|uniref:uncharacterized protein LOC129792995 n=1 Tax=Lutzomyia longipalpis TaxID=7200 RepID=UPI00248363C6|nr:uncharacterized protein LOC129792995 [Lutzomyia longipalpis]
MNLQANECEIEKLRQEVEKLEKILPTGLDLTSIPRSCDNLLTEYATIWAESGVDHLDRSSLAEAFLVRQKLRTDNSVICDMLKIDIESLERELKEDEKDIAMLEKFSEDLHVKTKDQIKKEHLQLTKQCSELNQKIPARPSNINLDEIIRKVELLETSSKGSKAQPGQPKAK